MKFIRIAFAIAILALAPQNISAKIYLYTEGSGPSKDETKAWIHENVSGKVYIDYDSQKSGILTFDGDIMQVTFEKEDSILTYGYKIPISDLEIRVSGSDYADANRLSIYFKCAFGKRCVSEWVDLDMEDAFKYKDNTVRLVIENKNNMPHRARKAFEHLIRISGGKSPAKEKLF